MTKTSPDSLTERPRNHTPHIEPFLNFNPEVIVYTIGHSTRKIEDFIRILHAHKITLLADIRTIPRSRHNPQFNEEALAIDLSNESIKYIHIPSLGGLRRPSKDSMNAGWRNPSFRGYADYMQTKQFETGVRELVRNAEKDTVAVMCAEGNPFRCHRLLLADALTIRRVRVMHISSAKSSSQHKMTSFAVVQDNKVIYPKSE